MRPNDQLLLRYLEELVKRGLRSDVDLIIPNEDVFRIGKEYAESRRSYMELYDALVQYVKPRIRRDVAEIVVREYLGEVDVDYVELIAKRVAKWYIDILRLFNIISFSGYQLP